MRKRIPKAVQGAILSASKRRCCLCAGLESDLSPKRGQIAHLDRDNANNDLDNLAFLCLDHHDQYDSRTRQSKSLTMEEVVQYRDRLYELMAQIAVGGQRGTEEGSAGAPIGKSDASRRLAVKIGVAWNWLANEALLTARYLVGKPVAYQAGRGRSYGAVLGFIVALAVSQASVNLEPDFSVPDALFRPIFGWLGSFGMGFAKAMALLGATRAAIAWVWDSIESLWNRKPLVEPGMYFIVMALSALLPFLCLAGAGLVLLLPLMAALVLLNMGLSWLLGAFVPGLAIISIPRYIWWPLGAGIGLAIALASERFNRHQERASATTTAKSR